MSGMERSLEQIRAEHAMLKAKEARERFRGEPVYRSYVDRLPAFIISNGLGQALATEQAAGAGESSADAEAHQYLYKALGEWLCRDGGVFQSGKDVLEQLLESPEKKYLQAQAEALAWLEWHKKFCRAYFKSGQARSGD